MKKIFFTVGPSEIYPTLSKHIQKALQEQIPSLSHRGAEFKELFKEVTENLRKLMGIPKEYEIFFVASALEGMERTVQSLVEKESFHIVTGSFGKAWEKIAVQLGKKTTNLVTKDGEGFDVSKLKIPKSAELICLTQNDTSTGMQIPMPEIYYIKDQNPEKLIAIDVVSSVPYVEIDFKKIDVTFFSVQKGFGLPAGLGVIIVSPEALKKGEKVKGKGGSIGSFHSFLNLSEKAREFQTPETPNVLNIYLFNSVLKDMLKTGIGKIRKETDQKAKLLYDFFTKHQEYNPFVKYQPIRSQATLVIDVNGKSKAIREKTAKAGILIGAGYGSYKENHLRIANFPAHSLKQVKELIKLLK